MSAMCVPGGYCIKLLLKKNSGYFNQSFLPMVKSMVTSCLPEFSEFFPLAEKVYAIARRWSCQNSGGDKVQMVETIQSLTHHVCNVHIWSSADKFHE